MLWVHNIPIDGEEYKWVNIWKGIYFSWGERYEDMSCLHIFISFSTVQICDLWYIHL